METTASYQVDQNPCPMSATDAMFHFDLESLEPEERIKLANILTASAPNLDPNKTAIAKNRVADIRDNSRDAMEFLAQAEAILELIAIALEEIDPEAQSIKLSLRAAIAKVSQVYDTLDTCVEMPLTAALEG